MFDHSVSHITTHPEQDTIEASFALLEVSLEMLAELAPVQTPSQILDLVPAALLSQQQLIVVELIKFDIASAAEQGLARTLEFYWPTVGNILPQDAIPFDLVLEEVQLRRARGEHPRWDEYRLRFPDLAETIGKWLAGEDVDAFSGLGSKVPELAVKTQVDDFEILKQLGQGAFARVYLARQVSMQRLVALKATTRGSEEPQALSQLDHANIVRVYDQRKIADPETTLLYMQYLAGGTLADCVRLIQSTDSHLRSGRCVLQSIDQNLLSASQSVPEQSTIRNQLADLKWPEVVAWIGIQLAEGLYYANCKGILHRDVKPANILLSAEAVPKLADFNVSCSGLSGRAGAAAYFGGSLAYMSPEQLQVADPTDPATADQLDGRSDLYSLGIVLWELWQGKRPWHISETASSWTEAVQVQRRARSQPMQLESQPDSPTARVLHQVLQAVLSCDREQRPLNGKQFASRLRLALHPELAQRFEPSSDSVAGRLLRIPILVLSAVIIFGPNTAASAYNYFYNLNRMYEDFVKPGIVPEMVEHFEVVANIVNGVVFPLGAVIFWWIITPYARIVKKGRVGNAVSDAEIDRVWNIGLRATLICAVLWSVSGLVFALVFASWHSEFDADDAFHFFISLVMCGGIAGVYPYFGMTLLSTLIYYPQLISRRMQDAHLEERSVRLLKQSRLYLLSAAIIPLSALALTYFSQGDSRSIILVGAGLTLLGLLAAYSAHRTLEQVLQQYAKVFGQVEKKLEL